MSIFLKYNNADIYYKENLYSVRIAVIEFAKFLYGYSDDKAVKLTNAIHRFISDNFDQASYTEFLQSNMNNNVKDPKNQERVNMSIKEFNKADLFHKTNDLEVYDKILDFVNLLYGNSYEKSAELFKTITNFISANFDKESLSKYEKELFITDAKSHVTDLANYLFSKSPVSKKLFEEQVLKTLDAAYYVRKVSELVSDNDGKFVGFDFGNGVSKTVAQAVQKRFDKTSSEPVISDEELSSLKSAERKSVTNHIDISCIQKYNDLLAGVSGHSETESLEQNDGTKFVDIHPFIKDGYQPLCERESACMLRAKLARKLKREQELEIPLPILDMDGFIKLSTSGKISKDFSDMLHMIPDELLELLEFIDSYNRISEEHFNSNGSLTDARSYALSVLQSKFDNEKSNKLLETLLGLDGNGKSLDDLNKEQNKLSHGHLILAKEYLSQSSNEMTDFEKKVEEIAVKYAEDNKFTTHHQMQIARKYAINIVNNEYNKENANKTFHDICTPTNTDSECVKGVECVSNIEVFESFDEVPDTEPDLRGITLKNIYLAEDKVKKEELITKSINNYLLNGPMRISSLIKFIVRNNLDVDDNFVNKVLSEMILKKKIYKTRCNPNFKEPFLCLFGSDRHINDIRTGTFRPVDRKFIEKGKFNNKSYNTVDFKKDLSETLVIALDKKNPESILARIDDLEGKINKLAEQTRFLF